jgi:hypothetical protein
VALGFYTDEQLGEALAEQWGTTFVTLYDRQIPSDVIRLISEPMAQLYRVVPLELKGDRLTVASADPQKIQVADELRTLLGYDIHICVATEAETVERVGALSADEFFTRYYATNTPVVLTDVVTRWRAHGLWTPAYFKEHFGDVEVLHDVTFTVEPGEVVALDIIPFFRRQLQLIGSRNANFAELNQVMDLVAQGRFKPVIHAALPLAQAALAHRTMGARDVFGKVVLLP